MSNHLFDLARARIAAPDTTFLETPDGRRISYADLVAMTGRYANALAGFGVVVGDRVAVQVEKSPEALALYLACVRAGAIFLPLNTGYTAAELEHFLTDAEPRLFVVAPDRAAALAALAAGRGARLETLGTAGDGRLN